VEAEAVEMVRLLWMCRCDPEILAGGAGCGVWGKPSDSEGLGANNF